MLLTLALPVHNDVEAARQTLPNLIQCVMNSKHPVELIISDNCSNDGVYEVATSLCAGMSSAKVLRQSSNLGFAGNLVAIAQESLSTYVWYVGAGEILVLEEFNRVLDVLMAEEFDWGTVYGVIAPRGITPELNQTFGSQRVSTLTTSDSDQNDLEVVNHLISLNIFRREIIVSHGLNGFAGLGASKDYWPHFESICQFSEASRLKGKTIRWFNYLPLTVISPGNPTTKSWDQKEDGIDVFFAWYAACSRLSEHLPKSKWLKEKKKALRGEHLARFIFMSRKLDVIPRGTIQVKLGTFNLSPLWYFIDTIVNFLPRRTLFALATTRRWFLGLKSKGMMTKVTAWWGGR